MSEKTFINGVFVKEVKFNNGGSVMNVDINVDKFIEELQKHRNEKGYAKFTIGSRKEPGKFGDTHTVYLNDYKPKEKVETEWPRSTGETADDKDSLPF